MKKRTKLNKYQPVIDREIDLHGLSREAARRVVLDALRDGLKNNERLLRVIIGKGLHSGEGGSVLGPLVKAIFNEQGLRYRESKREDGGEGALIVQLSN